MNMEKLIELKGIKDEYKAINFLYDLVNDIYEKDNFLPVLNEFCTEFLKMNFDLQLHSGFLMITNGHKNSIIIKNNRDLIIVNAEKLATEFLIEKGVDEKEHKKKIDFLLKSLK